MFMLLALHQELDAELMTSQIFCGCDTVFLGIPSTSALWECCYC